MRKILVLLPVLIVAMVSSAHAKRGYGKAGCGLGSLILGDSGTGGQIFAATTNGTSGSQSFGISTGTSNCVPDAAPEVEKKAMLFIEANQMALANDVARGSGEAMNTLSGIFGCRSAEDFGSLLQVNYDKVFPVEGANPEQITNNILKTIKSNLRLAKSCQNLG